MTNQILYDHLFNETTENTAKLLSLMKDEMCIYVDSIFDFTELLQGEYFGPLNEIQKEYVRCIDQNGNHLVDIMNNLLVISNSDLVATELKIEERNIAIG